MRHRLAVLAATALLSACAGNQGPCTLGIAADLPITTQYNAYFTDIVINGGVAHVRVDTGAATNLLSDAAAERLHMTRVMLNGAAVNGVGGARPVNLAVSDSVQLGRARGTHIAFITAATDTFPPGTDGLLGMDFLSQFDDDLDFAVGHLRLVRAHGDCTSLHSPLHEPLYAVPFRTISTNGSPVVDVQIDGKKFVAIVDSGATNSLLFRSAAQRLGLNVSALLASDGLSIRGVGGATRATLGRLSKPVEIGALRISNLPIAIADQDSGNEVDMLLGYNFEKIVHLWISHSGRTLLMQYPAQATPVASE
jgi:predicted aspartyl protease